MAPVLFNTANRAEVLRSSQKDESFINQFEVRLAEILQRTLGSRFWLYYSKWIRSFCELTYLSATTLSLRQTLGEEYTGILLINEDLKSLPSIHKRVLMTLIQCFGPTIVERAINKVTLSVQKELVHSIVKREIKDFLTDFLSSLKFLPSFVLRIHLAMFYLGSSFYHVPKRILGIRYLLIRHWYGDPGGNAAFRTLGLALFAHIFLSTVYSTLLLLSRRNQQKDFLASDLYVSSAERCSLCAGKRANPSVAPCGHLFCWECLHRSLKTSEQCPLCRHPAKPPEVVPLINFPS